MLHKLRKLTFSHSSGGPGTTVAPGLFHIYQTSHAVVSGTHRRNEKQRRVERAFLLFFWSANPGTAPWLWTLLPRGCELSWPRARARDTDKYECACSTTWPRRMVAWQGSKATTVSENVLSHPGTRVSRGEGEPGIWQFSSSVHLKFWRLRNILVFSFLLKILKVTETQKETTLTQ